MSTKTAAPVWKCVLGVIAMGASGALVGAMVARGVVKSDGLRAALDVLTAWDLLALPVLFLLVIAVHEGGHLWMGLRQGMRFLLYVVGPFGFVRGTDGVRFRWFFNLGTLGGVAATMPDPQRPLATQMKPVVLGGPAASLLLALAGAVVAMAVDGRVAAYALIVALLSCMIFVVTALPFRAGGFMSDGMQWLAYRRGGVEVERRARVTALMGMSMGGTRPRDLDEALLRQAQALATGDEVLSDMGVWHYSYARALDHGRIDEAATWLARMGEVLDQYPDGFRQGIAIELAIFEALHRARLGEAQQWLARARGGIVDRSRRHLAEAAVALLQGNHQGAASALDAAEGSRRQAMDAGFAHLSIDQIAALRASPLWPPAATHAAA